MEGLGKEEQEVNELNLTPRVERILQLANLERQSDGARFTSTEHVLIAILLDGGSATAFTLKEKGITVDEFRKFTRGDKP